MRADVPSARSRVPFSRAASLTETQVARLKRLLLHAFQAGTAALMRDEFADALRALGGGTAMILAETLWSQSGGVLLWTTVQEVLTTVTTEAASQQNASAPRLLPGVPLATIESAFNVVDERVIRVVQASGGEHIRGIDLRTRAGIRQTIEQSWRLGLSTEALQQAIADQVGVTAAQAQRLHRSYQQALADGETPARALRLLHTRAQQVRRARAEAIARTETLAASNRGQHLYWEEMARQGLLNSATMRRGWLIARDERLCPLCKPVPGLNPRGVAFQQAFVTPVGLVMHPPLHVNCRCTVTLQRVD